MGRSNRYAPEVRDRAVRLVSAQRGEYDSEWAAICSIAAKFGCWAETLRLWVRQSERDQGLRSGLSSEQRVELSLNPPTEASGLGVDRRGKCL